MNKKTWIIVGSILGVVLIGGLVVASTVVGLRNQMVTADENVNASWAQVENVLQRRADLVPNLVETVKGIAKQEQAVFVGVAEARSKVGGATTRGEKIAAHEQLGTALSRLLLVVEKYPELKSDKNFLQLQDELAGTENRIAVERRRYNESVQSYNVLIRRFPGNVVAGFFGFTVKDDYFKADEGAKEAPKVSFE